MMQYKQIFYTRFKEEPPLMLSAKSVGKTEHKILQARLVRDFSQIMQRAYGANVALGMLLLMSVLKKMEVPVKFVSDVDLQDTCRLKLLICLMLVVALLGFTQAAPAPLREEPGLLGGLLSGLLGPGSKNSKGPSRPPPKRPASPASPAPPSDRLADLGAP
ncbi:hypothetical protein [Parasitella parasitica]|uniref:Uncharacterized protein n=1 Tax=Parasitella parasitica TaxID=35722 RepID=A0A0B7NWI5_9FUNG|nr:hypothetical protein [Parasitella parasitica]